MGGGEGSWCSKWIFWSPPSPSGNNCPVIPTSKPILLLSCCNMSQPSLALLLFLAPLSSPRTYRGWLVASRASAGFGKTWWGVPGSCGKGRREGSNAARNWFHSYRSSHPSFNGVWKSLLGSVPLCGKPWDLAGVGTAGVSKCFAICLCSCQNHCLGKIPLLFQLVALKMSGKGSFCPRWVALADGTMMGQWWDVARLQPWFPAAGNLARHRSQMEPPAPCWDWDGHDPRGSDLPSPTGLSSAPKHPRNEPGSEKSRRSS